MLFVFFNFLCFKFFFLVLFLKIEVVEDDEDDTESAGVLELSKIREMRLVPSDATQCEFFMWHS